MSASSLLVSAIGQRLIGQTERAADGQRFLRQHQPDLVGFEELSPARTWRPVAPSPAHIPRRSCPGPAPSVCGSAWPRSSCRPASPAVNRREIKASGSATCSITSSVSTTSNGPAPWPPAVRPWPRDKDVQPLFGGMGPGRADILARGVDGGDGEPQPRIGSAISPPPQPISSRVRPAKGARVFTLRPNRSGRAIAHEFQPRRIEFMQRRERSARVPPFRRLGRKPGHVGRIYVRAFSG